MKFIEIDGERYRVERCWDCPCYDDGDSGYGHHCQHPKVGLDKFDVWYDMGCPLREED